MIQHVVTFTFGPDTTEEQRQAVEAGLAELPALIPEIRSYSFGRDLGLVEGNHDFAVVAEFADIDAYRTYSAHPAHQAFIAERLRPVLAGRAAVQFTVDG